MRQTEIAENPHVPAISIYEMLRELTKSRDDAPPQKQAGQRLIVQLGANRSSTTKFRDGRPLDADVHY